MRSPLARSVSRLRSTPEAQSEFPAEAESFSSSLSLSSNLTQSTVITMLHETMQRTDSACILLLPSYHDAKTMMEWTIHLRLSTRRYFWIKSDFRFHLAWA
jgi:hypothetical protein